MKETCAALAARYLQALFPNTLGKQRSRRAQLQAGSVLCLGDGVTSFGERI